MYGTVLRSMVEPKVVRWSSDTFSTNGLLVSDESETAGKNLWWVSGGEKIRNGEQQGQHPYDDE
jgi:hypothetical protein